MDKNKLEKEIEDLLNSLSTKSMNNIHQGPEMETLEKKLMSRIGILANINLSDINKRFEDLGKAISEVNYSIKAGIESNKLLAEETKKHNNSVRIWTIVLAIATILLVVSGIWQGVSLAIYTRETQKLSKVAQEQLDLQLQPALIINTEGLLGSPDRDLYLLNIGNGTALNIQITSENNGLQFINIPNFIEAKKEKSLYYVNDSVQLSKVSGKELEDAMNYTISFTENKEIKIRLDYENINNKKYFTKVAISNKGVRLIERGEVRN